MDTSRKRESPPVAAGASSGQAGEETQRQSEVAVPDLLAVGIAQVDLDGRWLKVNEKLCQITGYRREDLLARRILDITDPEDLAASLANFERLLAGEIPSYSMEKRYVRPDGTRVWVNLRSALRRDRNGRPKHIYGVIENITERKQWEDRLRQSEERYRRLVEIQTDLVTRFLSDGTLTFVNEAACRQLGRSREELLGRCFLPLVFDEDRPSVEQGLAAITFPNPVVMIENRVLCAGGQFRWIQWSCCGIFDAQGRVIECQAVGRDMTERREAEEALRKSEELRRLAEKAGGVGTFERDLRTEIQWWSPELETMYGLEPGSFEGNHDAWLKTIHPDDRSKVEAGVAKTMSSLNRQVSFDFRIIRPDGQVRWIEARPKLIGNRNGVPERVVGVNVDITSRKQAEQALQALNETLEQRVAERTAVAEARASQLQRLAVELARTEERERRRLAQVLHDHLQQLLVAAKLKLTPAARRAQDARVATGITAGVSLIDQAIAESRSLTSELSPPVLYDRGLAAGLEWLARRSEEYYHLSVVVETDPEADPEDPATKGFVFQAARELILNAQKHGQASSVHLQLARADENHLQLVVTDNGLGFEPETLETRAEAGGFGLFSIRERLDMIGGSLEIASSPGEGTRATLRVPVPHSRQATARTSPIPRPSAQPPESPAMENGRLRVLLADDHPLLRKGLADMLLEQPELDLVGEASDGLEAVEAALQLRPDAVLMDVTMPRLDGIEATRRIKQAAPEICVIGLSMHERADMASAMRSAGASEYLPKTVAVEDLIATLLKQCPRHARQPGSS